MKKNAPAHLRMARLNHRSDVPLHAQAQQLLRDMVQQPEYRNGGLLPDEITMAARLGVSRGTLRSAITKLVHEGLLERRAGVGTRLCSASGESGIAAWRSFSLEMARKGITVENYSQKLEIAEASVEAARALQISTGTKIWRLDRVRGWNRQPVLHSRSWFHPRLGLNGTEAFTKPLYEVLEKKTGVVADKAREEFSAVSADARLAKMLASKRGESLLLRSHTVFDTGGRPFEFALVHYVSSRFALTLEIRRDEK